MLVFSRKKCESIVIGENIVVEVLEVRGKKVRLGIEAPKEIPIKRDELCPLEPSRHHFQPATGEQ